MTNGVHTLTYRRPSSLGEDGLRLETSGGATATGPATHPRFFDGFLCAPEQGAKSLLAVAQVARARYFTPMTAQRLAEILDPVVTSNGDRLRFESFSGCCGVYARYDVLERGLDGTLLDRGTTNVDVNAPLRDALARVGGAEPLRVSVGPDDVTVTTLDTAVVERKVRLPERWLRGFAEASVALAAMDLRAELRPAEARRFLRSLPRSGTRGTLWAVASAGSLRVTARPSRGAVCLAGPERLEVLGPLLRFATALRVYGPATDGAPVSSAWELALPDARLTLTLSPDLSRGFSGEGGVLASLVDEQVDDDAETVAAALAWRPRIDVDDLADRAGLAPDRVRAALVRLGIAGRVGFDPAEAAYFHRELPYDTAGAERLNPRLRAARRLVDEGRVRVAGDVLVVRGDDHDQHVRRTGEGLTCTCPWWARYAGTRGPCRHVLAAQMVLG